MTTRPGCHGRNGDVCMSPTNSHVSEVIAKPLLCRARAAGFRHNGMPRDNRRAAVSRVTGIRLRRLTGHTRALHPPSSKGSPISGLLLAFLTGLTLLMPVNYRAGTDHAHPHTAFQLWVDVATGHSHQDDDNWDRPQRVTGVAAPAVESTSARKQETIELSQPPLHGKQADTVEPLTSHMTLQYPNLLGALSALIALMEGGTARPLWFGPQRLTGLVHRLDPPPPRSSPIRTCTYHHIRPRSANS